MQINITGEFREDPGHESFLSPFRWNVEMPVLNAHSLQPKEDFCALRDSYDIFLTENDVIGKKKSIYHIERRIEETGETFDDSEHIIYVNGADKDGSTALGKLMQDFFCADPDDMNHQ